MTLLFVDSCKGGDIDRWSAPTKWDTTSSGTRGTFSPRFAGGGWYSSCVAYKTITASSEVFLAGGWVFPTSGAATIVAAYSDTGATQHITVVRNASGKIEVRRGSSSGTVIATGATTVAASTWTHVEVRITVDDTTGVVQVRLNGSGSNEINFSGDTRNGGTSTNIDKVAFVASGSTARVTDMLVANSAGSVNNSWPGNRTIVALTPDGDATYNEGLPTVAGPHWSRVTGQPWGSGAIRMETTERETYSFTDAPWDTPDAIQVNLATQGDPSSPMPMRRMLRIAGTNYTGSSFTPAPFANDPRTHAEVLELNPATGVAWTKADLDGIEAGAEILSGGGPYEDFLIGISVEAVLDPTYNSVSMSGGGDITVDTPNYVSVYGGGDITIAVAGMTAGSVAMAGGGDVTADVLVTDYPLAPPADPTLTSPGAGEQVIQRRSETWDAPTLVDGVPVGWGPS